MPLPVVLEIGSHSLKFHYQARSGILQEERYPWTLGRDLQERGEFRGETLEQVPTVLGALKGKGFDSSLLYPLATSALRDVENCESLTRKLSDLLGTKIRVLTGQEEASLLANAYLERSRDLPALLGNMGGMTLELVYLSTQGNVMRDALPLGAVRVEHMGREEGQPWNREFVEAWIRSAFEDASALVADEVQCTGGPVRALAKVLEKRSFTLAELEELSEKVEQEGAPDCLSTSRKKLFLPGLLVLEEVMRCSRAKWLQYRRISLGQIVLRQLLRRYGIRAVPRRTTILDGLKLSDIDVAAKLSESRKHTFP